MAWTPTYRILTPWAIPSNLLTYITDATRQADALTWAGGSSLKAIKTFSNSTASRAIPVYPAIAFSDDNAMQEYDDDLVTCGYQCLFEVSIQNAVADTAVTQARYYAAAITSMIRDCPLATLAANTRAIVDATKVLVGEAGFKPIQAGNGGLATNDFLQAFDIRVTVSLIGSAFE